MSSGDSFGNNINRHRRPLQIHNHNAKRRLSDNEDIIAGPDAQWPLLPDMCGIDHDPYHFHTVPHPFALTVASLDEMAFRGQWHQELRDQWGSLPLSRCSSSSLSSPSLASAASPSSSASWHLPKSKSPLTPTGSSHTRPHSRHRSLAKTKASTLDALPNKRKATAPPDYAHQPPQGQHHLHAGSGSDCKRRPVSADSGLSAWSPEPTPVFSPPHRHVRRPGVAPTRPPPAPVPTPRVTIDHAVYPDIMNTIITAASRDVLHTLYNTSRGMRARMAPMLESHVVLGLREVERGAAPVIDLHPYGCAAAAPWFSWQGWAEPKPVDVSGAFDLGSGLVSGAGSGSGRAPECLECTSLARNGCPACDSFRPSPHLIEIPTFHSMLAASEAQLGPLVRAVLCRAGVIDLVGHLRLAPHQPTLAAPDTLRVHIHQVEADEYQRVDTPGWDEHTLDRFKPRRLVVLSRLVDYCSTDTNPTEVAVAPTCAVNSGTEHLVLRIAYDPADPRLPRSAIRVPTMYRPGLPDSIKRITILFVPSDTYHHTDDNGDELDVGGETRDMDLHRVGSAYVPRLGMLDSTAAWVAGYLPRGVHFTFVGVEGLPATALNLISGPGRCSLTAGGCVSSTQTLIDSGASLTAAVRDGIVKQRRLANSAAIDAAMRNLSVVTLDEYERRIGKAEFALETEE